MGNREDAVRRAIELSPTSIRALAHEAGVSPTLLLLIRDGERTATAETLEAMAEAAERMGSGLLDAARILRHALEPEGADHE